MVGFENSKFNSLKNFLNQIHSLALFTKPINSLSAVDRATIFCLLLVQATGVLLMVNTNPDVDFRSTVSPAQSASEYPVKLNEQIPLLYNNPKSTVPRRYRRICLTYAQWLVPGLLEKICVLRDNFENFYVLQMSPRRAKRSAVSSELHNLQYTLDLV